MFSHFSTRPRSYALSQLKCAQAQNPLQHA